MPKKPLAEGKSKELFVKGICPVHAEPEPPTHGFSVQYSAHKALICKGLQACFGPKMRITSG